jgi:hypothetical protein
MEKLNETQIYHKTRKMKLSIEERYLFRQGIRWAEKMHRIETLERKGKGENYVVFNAR